METLEIVFSTWTNSDALTNKIIARGKELALRRLYQPVIQEQIHVALEHLAAERAALQAEISRLAEDIEAAETEAAEALDAYNELERAVRTETDHFRKLEMGQPLSDAGKARREADTRLKTLTWESTLKLQRLALVREAQSKLKKALQTSGGDMQGLSWL